MDSLIEQLRPSILGPLESATVPSTALSKANQYVGACGVTAAEYVAERRRDDSWLPRICLPEPHNIARRKIGILLSSPYLNSFFQNEESDILGFSELQKVEGVLRKSAHYLASERDSSIDNAARYTRKLESHHMLVSLRLQIEREELQTYDHFHDVLLTCVQVLKRVKEIAEADLSNDRTSSAVKMTDDIIRFAVTCDNTVGMRKHSPIIRIASMLENLVREGGSMGYDQAQEFLRGPRRPASRQREA